MLKILYQHDHAARAKALSAVTPGSTASEIDSTKPSIILGLHTLIFFGHGDPQKLCGKAPDEMVKLIGSWRLLNWGLKTIEIITCNGRFNANGDSYAVQLKSRFGVLSATSGLTVKGMPVGQNASTWSILLVETVYNSWAYVTAAGTTDKLMMEAQGLLRFTKNQNGGLVSFKGNLATRANEVISANPLLQSDDVGQKTNGLQRSWTMNYGLLGNLRKSLSVVR